MVKSYVGAVQAVLKNAAAEGRCTAGEEVAVQLQLRDQYGTPASMLSVVITELSTCILVASQQDWYDSC